MRKPTSILTPLGLVLGMAFASGAGAQEILPFPPAPSGSTAGLTMKDSVYKKRVEPKRLADGCQRRSKNASAGRSKSASRLMA